MNDIEYELYDVRVNEIGTPQHEKLGDMYDLYRYIGNRRYYRVGLRLMF